MVGASCFAFCMFGEKGEVANLPPAGFQHNGCHTRMETDKDMIFVTNVSESTLLLFEMFHN